METGSFLLLTPPERLNCPHLPPKFLITGVSCSSSPQVPTSCWSLSADLCFPTLCFISYSCQPLLPGLCCLPLDNPSVSHSTFFKDHREEILGELHGNLDMLSQEPDIIFQVLGFAGKQSWWLVSCKWKFGHTGEGLPKGPKPGGTPTGVFSRVQITSCWCQYKDPFEGSPPGPLEAALPQIPVPNAFAFTPLSFMIPAMRLGRNCRLMFQMFLYRHRT